MVEDLSTNLLVSSSILGSHTWVMDGDEPYFMYLTHEVVHNFLKTVSV